MLNKLVFTPEVLKGVLGKVLPPGKLIGEISDDTGRVLIYKNHREEGYRLVALGKESLPLRDMLYNGLRNTALDAKLGRITSDRPDAVDMFFINLAKELAKQDKVREG